jgi:hypothetical protein
MERTIPRAWFELRLDTSLPEFQLGILLTVRKLIFRHDLLCLVGLDAVSRDDRPLRLAYIGRWCKSSAHRSAPAPGP